MNTAVAEARKSQVNDIRIQLESMLSQFAVVLPKHVTPERFVRVVLTAVQTNPDLLECDRRSFFAACMRAATQGYVPDGEKAALVPFKDKRGNKIVTLIKMIAGLREKVRESGEILTWEAHVVHERDVFDYMLGDTPQIVHRPVLKDRGPVIAAYSVATFRNGEKSREVMSIEDINKVRAVSRAEHGPWETWFDEMCRKTVAKRHAKVLPTSNAVEQFFNDDDEPDAPARSAIAPVARSLPPGASLGDQLDKIAGADEAKPAPASEAAAEQGDDVAMPSTLSGEEAGVSGDTFAAAVTRHAQALTAAAKDGPLNLQSAWARVPAAFKESLQGTYESLAGAA